MAEQQNPIGINAIMAEPDSLRLFSDPGINEPGFGLLLLRSVFINTCDSVKPI
jgi:hypothetical protein